MHPIEDVRAVHTAATAHDIEAQCRATGLSRLAVTDQSGRVVGWVHVRDAVTAVTYSRAVSAAERMTAPFQLQESADLIDAVASMRNTAPNSPWCTATMRPPGSSH
jgi:CBS domain containing-hemolysin-like protein